ncbi:MAG: DEAD/DEAH box helicase [Chloroflexota bacterium]|nr:DEAD/DEAH box helicase [Chloroflexota bacterium]
MALTSSRAVNTTDYHAKFYAHQLSRRFTGDSPDKLAASLVDALVDLNPHQIDAALFAFHSPLSNGVILADEVGLGKTIEAGLVISQFWAERKRQILILTPANLRKQWSAELKEKFHLPVMILEGMSYNQARRMEPKANPFDRDRKEIIIASIPFASGKEDDLAGIPWDLVVIDEAHRLRNADGKQAMRIKQALSGRKKLLLTATPLQNRLDELWGLVSLVDERFFGDRKSFRSQYAGQIDEHAFNDLRRRLRPLVQRTLRRDAREFISYTERIPMLEEFTPTDEERDLYDKVSEYLRRDNLMALPSGQRHLMTMVLNKLLSSSTFAIASALRTMSRRLERELTDVPAADLEEELGDDYDALAETSEEWDEGVDVGPVLTPPTVDQRAAIQREILELNAFADQAEAIAHNAKGTALIKGLHHAFTFAEEKGAPRKAIVFTESRKTQQYLHRLLSDIPEFADKLMLFDGANNDPKSREIYTGWRARHAGTDMVTGSRSADIRAALVDYFRDTGEIMIATEAAAEGINLQFCSLIINYDLPWNPQRIEQRIGRCHRYGQKHDVVVVNFLNKENLADRRVYELLNDKFHLFSGVFGATDEVLGSIESGVGIERRIAEVYQFARDAEEINRSFQQMQLAMSEVIDEKRTQTERKLFEHFDENVAERFAVRQRGVESSLDRIERALMTLAKHELRDYARFSNDRSFVLNTNPYGDLSIPTGRYDMPARSSEQKDILGYHFRPGHPLSQRLIAEAGARELPPAEVVFDYGAMSGRQSAIEQFIGASGWITASRLAIEMEAGAEDHLLLSGYTDDGQALDHEQIETLFRIVGRASRTVMLDSETQLRLATMTDARRAETMQSLEQRILQWMDQEQEKIDAWADDRRANLVGDIERLDKEITGLKRERRTSSGDLNNRRRIQTDINQLTKRRDDLEDRNRARRREIENEAEELIAHKYDELNETSSLDHLFTIRWRLEQ